MEKLLSQYRLLLTSYNSVLAYSLLGIIGGLASGMIVLAFEVAITQLGGLLAQPSDAGDFESLPTWLLIALPAGGATVLGGIYALLKPEDRETGIVHVISCMHANYGALPLRNAIVQFFGGAFALATGQSGGREGPGVHLGGAINSLLGQWLHLPNNSLRVLVACGTAGGISAAFQTPLAGVIFAMEVIVAEYTVVGFIPVILAAVAASAVSQYFSPDSVLFALPELHLHSLLELPLIILLGFCCGMTVSAYIRMSSYAASFSHRPVWLRFAIAGTITGLLAAWVPQVLGLGYDTLAMTLEGQIAVSMLLGIAAAKLIATAVCCGVGMPVGLIAPNLIIGACIGGVMGTVLHAILPNIAADPTLYILLGMGAAMGAVLNAPLAAILAIMEMTHTISISMAAMLAIVTATLTNTGLFGQRSAHQSVLHQLLRSIPDDPVNQLLHRSAVTATMDPRAVRVPVSLDEEDFTVLLGSTPTWCVIERDGNDLYMVRGEELLTWLKETPFTDGMVELTAADIRRWTVTEVPVEATLKQATDAMRLHTCEAACVYQHSQRTGKKLIQGVVTRERIENFSLAGLQ